MPSPKAIYYNVLRVEIVDAAVRIVSQKGIKGLTARNVAAAVGCAPGTIYNVYRDMGALVTDVNYKTLGQLEEICRAKAAPLPDDFTKLRAIARAYIDFANDNERLWEALFADSRRGARLPGAYKRRVLDIFEFIESSLRTCAALPPVEARNTARLLWAALHGITVLMMDGRLQLIGVENPHDMVDDLLKKYFAEIFEKECVK